MYALVFGERRVGVFDRCADGFRFLVTTVVQEQDRAGLRVAATLEGNDDELEEVMRESSELSTPISSSRAERFYDRMRERIRGYLDRKSVV